MVCHELTRCAATGMKMINIIIAEAMPCSGLHRIEKPRWDEPIEGFSVEHLGTVGIGNDGPFGLCPICGAKSVERERRFCGDATYPSARAVVVN